MRIAIGVHGRFSAFNAGAELLAAGNDVRLFTNYPGFAVEKFGYPAAATTSFTGQGVAARLTEKLGIATNERVEAVLKRSFGLWLARRITKFQPDVAWCWSGVAEEAFKRVNCLRVLNRSSFHICAQRDLLQAESVRTAHELDHPGEWIVNRELREYALADMIIVPSIAAKRSFGPFLPDEKVSVVPLAADLSKWRPSDRAAQKRQQRIASSEKLRVLYVGNLSFQKGLYDLAAVAEALHDRMSFRFTGRVMPECRSLAQRLSRFAQVDGHVPEHDLARVYEWADIFMMGSIQDGFAVVIAQAAAAGLPFIATENTGAAEVLQSGAAGWIVPIRDSAAMIERLTWCNEHREDFAQIVSALHKEPVHRSWRAVANDLISLWKERI